MEFQLKKALPLFLLVFFAPALAYASVIIIPANSLGLVGYWKFNEGSGTTAHDSSGTGNNGTLSGSPAPTWVAGELGVALSFDGSNSYVDIGTPASLEGLQVPVTITAWFNTTSNSGDQPIYSAYGSTGGGQLWSMIRIDSGTLLYYTSTSGGGYQSYGSFRPSLNQWHFVAVTISGSLSSPTVTITLDGQSQTGSLSALDASPDKTIDIQIGGDQAVGSEKFAGTIDDVHVFARALSSTEITALYTNSAGTAKLNSAQSPGTLSSGLIDWFTMDGKDTNWATGKETDESGKGAASLLSNLSTTTAPVLGKIGQALKFNGTSSYMNLPSLPSLSNYSISFWAKPNNCGSSAELQFFDSPSDNVGVSCKTGGVIANWAGGSSYPVTGSNVWTNGQWIYITVTSNGGSNKLYINGTLNVSGTAGNSFSSGTGYIGQVNGGGRYYGGLIDDFRLYNRALSASEVKQLYNLGTGTHEDTSTQNLQDGSSLGSGLVGYWKFDGATINWKTGKVSDLSGKGNNGSLISMSTTSSPTIGIVGQALKFDGVSQYVTLGTPSTYKFSAQPFSVSAWVKLSANTDQYARIIGFDSGGNPTTGFTLRVYNYTGWEFYFDDGTITINDGVNTAYSTTGFGVGTWHHLVGIYDGSNVKLYVDGALAASASVGSLSPNWSNVSDFEIGSRLGAPASNHFPGSIDDVRIYNRALSASEIKQLYTMGK